MILALFLGGRDCYAKPVSPQVASTQFSVAEKFLQSVPEETCNWTSEIKDRKHLKLILERYELAFFQGRSLFGIYGLDILDFYAESELTKYQKYRDLQRTMLEVFNLREHLEAVIGTEKMKVLQSKLETEFRTARFELPSDHEPAHENFYRFLNVGRSNPPPYVGDFEQRIKPPLHPWDMKSKSPIPTMGQP